MLKIFLLSFISMQALAFEMATDLKAELSLRNRVGKVVGMAPIRLAVYHPTAANLMNATDCEFQIGKEGALSMGKSPVSFRCVYTGNHVIISQEAILAMIERSRQFSLLFFNDIKDFDELFLTLAQDLGEIKEVDRQSDSITKLFKDLAARWLNYSRLIAVPLQRKNEYSLTIGDKRNLTLKVIPQ